MPPKKTHSWMSFSSITQALVGIVLLSGVIASALMWSMTSWADDRYVLKGELLAAITIMADTINEGNSKNRIQSLEADIATLQDDIIFFEDEGAASSVRRYCRQLPKLIQQWETETTRGWNSDPIVRSACQG